MSSSDELLVPHLAAGRSYSAIAQLTGISERTIVRRMRSPAFRRLVRQARGEVLERALGHLSRGASEAAVTLRNLLRSANEKIKLGAARVLLAAEAKFRESEELAADIDDLQVEVSKLKKLENRRSEHERAW